jgi:hypothetical protein
MATTPNYGWVTPAPTDFVTDLPADFEVFADAVDADLVGLLGGTTGQVLTKVSGTDHDFAFATAATAPSQSFTLLNTGGTALTGASSVTISGIDKSDLLIVVDSASSDTTGEPYLFFRFNGDTGSNYSYFGYAIVRASTYGAGLLVAQDEDANTQILAAQSANNAASKASGGLRISACKSTTPKPYSSHFGWNAGGGNNNSAAALSGLYLGTSAITSVTVGVTGGNLDAGTVYIYGSDV